MLKIIKSPGVLITLLALGAAWYFFNQEPVTFKSQFKKKFSNSFDSQTHYFKNLKFLQGEWKVSPTAQYKPIFVFRFEHWNPASLKAIPFFNVIQKKYSDRLEILGITSNDSPGLRELLDSRFRFPVAHDPQQRIDLFFSIKKIPFFCLVSPEGTVFYEGTRIDEKLLSEGLLLVRREKYR